MRPPRHLAAVPDPDPRVVSLGEWRGRRAAAHRVSQTPPPLRLTTPDETAPRLRLDVFLRRARAVMAETEGDGVLVAFPSRIA